MFGAYRTIPYRYADFNQSLPAQFGTERLLHPQDFQKIYDWLEVLKLPEEVVLMLVSHCIRTRGAKFQFRSADKMAQEWADAGIRTISDAEEMLHRSTRAFDEVRQVLRRLGKRHAPSMDDEALYQKWTTDWEFTLDAILAA
ncbi:MAG: DnaD domain protein, partial [Clostridia bacterium]